VDAQELQERIAAFPRWDYLFQFDGGMQTPLRDRARINRHEQRRRHFFEPLLALLGGSLRGRRVLDIGCSAGFWALAAIEAGAELVVGVDLSREYLDQAELVFAAKGVDPARYSFEQGDVLERDLGKGFDVVLCLGLLDHVCKPVELFERMAATGAELLVIDTTLSRARASIFEVSRLPGAREIPGDGLVLIPSRDALADLTERVGFRSAPLALNVESWDGMDDYRRRRRLAFICSRTLDLGGLELEAAPSRLPWWVRDPRALTDV
jgi:tRNA (mo5U34)-methyltransferase